MSERQGINSLGSPTHYRKRPNESSPELDTIEESITSISAERKQDVTKNKLLQYVHSYMEICAILTI